MKKRIISIIIIVTLVFVSFPTSKAMQELRQTNSQNLDWTESYYGTFSSNSLSEYTYLSLGTIPSGKILSISVDLYDTSSSPSVAKDANTKFHPMSVRNTSTNVYAYSRGGDEKNMMTYFKIDTSGNYELTLHLKTSSLNNHLVTVHVYVLDAIDGFEKYDAIEGQSGNYNYVVSNLPEQLGNSQNSIVFDFIDSSSSVDLASVARQSTTLIDGSTRYLPVTSSTHIVPKVNSINNLQISEDVNVILEKLRNNEPLALTQVSKYNEFIKNNDLEVIRPLSVNDTTQLGEYGYYLSRSRINGNANIYWEHVSQFGNNMYFGILLENKSNASLKITLHRRSFDSTDESDKDSLNNVWLDFFEAVKMPDMSDLSPTSVLTIPANEARWVSLYSVPSQGYNIFNGQLGITIQNNSGTVYTGNDLYCYSFIMTDWTNPEGQTMYQTVKNNIGTSVFTRASGAPNSETISLSHSGSGNGARLLKTFDEVIDITNNRFSFVLTGLMAPYFNNGELIPLYHAGPTSDGSYPNGYTIENASNYGVVYKLSFAGFNTTQSGKQIKLKIKFNPLVNTHAVDPSINSGAFVTLCGSNPSYEATAVKVGTPSSSFPYEVTLPWNIVKNSPFDLYIIIGGMTSMPPEFIFFEA